MRKTITRADLAKKVCKRGHEGEYVLRKDGSSACRSCSRLSSENHRGAHEAKATKLREKSTERLAELNITIDRLRLQLEIAEAEKNFLTKTLALLNTAK